MKKYEIISMMDDNSSIVTGVAYIGTTADIKALYKSIRRASEKESTNLYFLFGGAVRFSENKQVYGLVISDDDIDHNVANLGSAVTLKDLESGEEMEFSIVGSAEVNSLEFKISNESPLGKAMIGKKRGDIIKVEFMGNEVKYQVLDVKRY